MANDAFLELSGISGVATDSKHKNWIEITSFSFGITDPSDGLYRSDDTSNVVAPKPDPINIVKKVDKTSPLLASLACDPQQTAKTATIALCGRSGSKIVTVSTGGLPTYMEYELKGVLIKSYNLSGGSGYATETLTLTFTEIKWTYTDGNISGSWKHTENKMKRG